MPRKPVHLHLSRRESQIMDALYRLGEGSAEDVQRKIRDASYNSVRVILGILEEKGYLTHRKEGRKYVYRPKVPLERAKRSAVRHLLDTFFGGSTPQAVSALLDLSARELADDELEELEELVRRARKGKR